MAEKSIFCIVSLPQWYNFGYNDSRHFECISTYMHAFNETILITIEIYNSYRSLANYGDLKCYITLGVIIKYGST